MLGLLLSLLAAQDGGQEKQSPLEACLAQLQRQPKALGPYQCLLSLGRGEGAAVRRLLERLVRLQPDDPRPRFYLALVRDFAGEVVAEREFLLAAEGFRREGEPIGRVYSLTSLAGNRCFVHEHCDGTAEGFVTEAELVAEE